MTLSRSVVHTSLPLRRFFDDDPVSFYGSHIDARLIFDDDPLSFCCSHIAARLIFDDDSLSFCCSHIDARLIFDDDPVSFYGSHIDSRLIFDDDPVSFYDQNDPILTEAAETTIRDNDIFELVSVFEQSNEISSAQISVTKGEGGWWGGWGWGGGWGRDLRMKRVSGD